jgi:hypothetical protein
MHVLSGPRSNAHPVDAHAAPTQHNLTLRTPHAVHAHVMYTHAMHSNALHGRVPLMYS